uniref:NDH-dependent cyclic electron flow 5 n=1 Tax=Hypseocharis bilobata TaxID=253189 RepID=A0A0F7GYH6_9ROSI
MASSSIFSPKVTPTYTKHHPSGTISSTTSTINQTFLFSNLPSRPLQYVNCKREFPTAKVASVPYQPINLDYLEEEFSGHGVTFEDIGDSCVAKMELENGSKASLMLPSGLITSYKAHMWHMGSLELLHTTVAEGEDGAPLIQGGISLALSCGSDDDGDQDSWSPTTWSLLDVRGSPTDSIQIEMISNDSEGKVRVKYIVTLEEDTLRSEFVVSNAKSTSLQLLGGVMSHLTVSSPDATYVLGLERANFFSLEPILSDFGIIPPTFGQKDSPGYGQVYGTLGSVLSHLGARNQTSNTESEEELEGEEDDNYKQLTDEMSRIYTSAPRNLSIMDRGRRNSMTVGSEGFEELYLFSPGSSHEFYSKYAYICVGQSARLKPVIIGPGDEWRGGQFLHNPNLE